MVMAAFENGTAEGIVCGDIDMALVSEDACLDLPISKSRAKGKRDVLVHRLEGLENEGITRGGGFNAVGEGGVDEVNKEGWWEEGDVGVIGVVRREEVRAAREGVGAG